MFGCARISVKMTQRFRDSRTGFGPGFETNTWDDESSKPDKLKWISRCFKKQFLSLLDSDFQKRGNKWKLRTFFLLFECQHAIGCKMSNVKYHSEATWTKNLKRFQSNRLKWAQLFSATILELRSWRYGWSLDSALSIHVSVFVRLILYSSYWKEVNFYFEKSHTDILVYV